MFYIVIVGASSFNSAAYPFICLRNPRCMNFSATFSRQYLSTIALKITIIKIPSRIFMFSTPKRGLCFHLNLIFWSMERLVPYYITDYFKLGFFSFSCLFDY